MKRLHSLFLVGLLALLVPTIALAQEEPPVDVSLEWSQSGVVPGGQIQLAGVFEVPDDHHITDKSFGLFHVTPELPGVITVVETEYPEGEVEKGEENYRGTAVVILTLAVDKSVSPGEYKLPVRVGWQLCRETVPEVCFLPNGQTLTTTLTVLQPGATPIPGSGMVFGEPVVEETVEVVAEAPRTVSADEPEVGNGLEDRLTSALERGSFTAFLLVFIAGILISFTPCVYPMIPIIIGFVGGGAGGSKAKGFILSLFFVIGLAITYAILGVIAGATGALFGAFMQNPIVLVFIIAVFIALGASMLGAFDITVPAAIQGKLAGGAKQGVIGAILLGGVTGIVAAPCAGPPLLVLLSWIGNTGNIVLGFALMGTFALGLGVLFIVIGTFAGAMTALPQAGQWMETIKKALGVIILAVALYYIGLLIPANWFTMLAGAFVLFVGLFMGAAKKWEGLATSGKIAKGLGILLLLAGAFYFVVGLANVNGVSLTASQGSETVSPVDSPEEPHIAWQVNAHEAVIAQARKEQKPVLIDFYADWCGVCVELEHKVWNQPAVISAAGEYLPLKLDYTRSSAELESLRKRYGVGGLPTVMILGSNGEEMSRFTSFKGPDEVVQWLNRYSE